MSDMKVLGYASHAEIRASTSTSETQLQSYLIPTPSGGRYDINLPISNPLTARQLLEQLGLKWLNVSQSNAYDLALSASKGTLAGELYVQQVQALGEVAQNTVIEVAKDAKKLGKYTPEHAKRIFDAQVKLWDQLKPIIPGQTRYTIALSNPELESRIALQRFTDDIAAIPKLTGRPADILTRNSIKRLNQSVSIAEDAPILINKKLAKKLTLVGDVIQVIELMPAATVALTTDNELERRKAVAEIGGKVSGAVVEKAFMLSTPQLCAIFGLGTGGWGFLGCGLIVAGAGIYFGKQTEGLVKELTLPPAPKPMPLP